MNFVSMDFETANGHRTSACSLALVLVRESQIVDSFYTLINPQENFSPRNIQIHHIRPNDVADAPTFDQVWPHIESLFDSSHLVAAHNASFDNSVLKNTLSNYGIYPPKFLTIDTVKTSRKFYPQLPNHKLDTVSRGLNIDLEHHHNALADSIACAEILIKTEQQFGADQIKKMVKLTS
ncbi:3'-5' exonuclease [Companilactobacillus sp.]|jgi:DNA polymerase-3 subunit epsilon|uniref:3'-5' exonuclease n=1 Tax=Companilactobacillus sp. TaxID=2767905 RepID=UPI0025C325BA|nr:3'-5' exonuclease [Companilactobacillus sp.]MCH4008752.1 3'-5' exonuclease [Companilactobacillus sp.]MCH4051069.1 3'-5' exonuclease [Companilactobacillus sp.]MCH4076695.1 3'-5' exonuclease [Companilactobacillus sp.]MCH4125270.1 3'-5' exonuclease [Companilactobacillus sp.]MCH4131810.1 3'-5' exonuclease [Companilactobacillus sp.]